MFDGLEDEGIGFGAFLEAALQLRATNLCRLKDVIELRKLITIEADKSRAHEAKMCEALAEIKTEIKTANQMVDTKMAKMEARMDLALQRDVQREL
jgi:hypothetical protein